MNFLMLIDNKHTYKFCMTVVYISVISNALMMGIFEVIFGKFNVVTIFVTVNYVQKWIVKLYYY